MRYFVIFLLFILSIEVDAGIRKDVINKDNSILTVNQTGGVFRDKNNKVWITSTGQLVSTNTERSEWHDYTDIVRESMLLNYLGNGLTPMIRAFYMNDDKHGNMFFYNWAGIAVNYAQSENWTFFTQDNPNLNSYPQSVYLNDIEYSKGSERIYTSGIKDTLFYAEYDSESNSYKMKNSFKSILDDKIENIYNLISINDDVVLVLSSNRFLLCNTKTGDIDSVSVGAFPGFFSDFDLSVYPVKPVKVPNQDRILIPRQYYESDGGKEVLKAEIYDVSFEGNTINTVSVVELPKTLEKSRFLFSAGWVNEEKTRLFLGNYSDMWIYNINNQVVSIIPTPPEYGEDQEQRWAANGGCVLYHENEIWLSNGNYGITICNLDELVNSAVPSVQVIDRDEFIPVLGVDKVYPVPAVSKIHIDYFQQIGAADEINLKIFDVNGNEVPNIVYNVQTADGMRKRLTISSGIKTQGIYFAEIKLKGYKVYTKFIYR